MDYKFIVNYIRITRCLASFFMPALAFIVSSSGDITQLFIVSIILVLGIAATYSYNSVKDIREDRDNYLHPNPLKESRLNVLVEKAPYMMFIIAILLSLFFLNIYSLSLFLSLALLSLVYSHFKIKRFFLVKTIYISFCYMVLFFSCYLAFSTDIIYEMLVTGVLICILMFGYSILSDIRDIEPDRKHNFITIPVRYGYETSIAFVMYLFILLNITVTLFYGLDAISLELATVFYMFIPFEVYIMFCLYAHDLKKIDNIKFASFCIVTLLLIFTDSL